MSAWHAGPQRRRAGELVGPRQQDNPNKAPADGLEHHGDLFGSEVDHQEHEQTDADEKQDDSSHVES